MKLKSIILSIVETDEAKNQQDNAADPLSIGQRRARELFLEPQFAGLRVLLFWNLYWAQDFRHRAAERSRCCDDRSKVAFCNS